MFTLEQRVEDQGVVLAQGATDEGGNVCFSGRHFSTGADALVDRRTSHARESGLALSSVDVGHPIVTSM